MVTLRVARRALIRYQAEPARFWSQCHFDRLTGCWLWDGRTNWKGYGTSAAGGAHRVAYELTFGPIPAGLQIDHLCSVRLCINPGHLEAVTLAENVRRSNAPSAIAGRRSTCPYGHPYTEATTYQRGKGDGRRCRICHRAAGIRYRRKHAATVGRMSEPIQAVAGLPQ